MELSLLGFDRVRHVRVVTESCEVDADPRKLLAIKSSLAASGYNSQY